MAKLKLHYDGWLALPAGLCQQLGLKTGDRLEAELVDGAVMLRPAKAGRTQHAAPAADTEPPAVEPPEPLPLVGTPEPLRRKPGRPRKDAAQPDPAAAVRKARGRPRKAAPVPEPEPNRSPIASIGPAKLVKKADLLPAAARPEEFTPQILSPARPESDDRSFVERRPFRQVEVRKLGPGRGHNRSRQANGHAGQAG